MEEKHLSEVKTDVRLLLECLQYQGDNPSSSKQALLTLSSIFSRYGEVKSFFKDIGGLQFVFDHLASITNSDVQAAAFFCLGCCIERNVFCQRAMSTASVFKYIQGILSNELCIYKLKQSAVFFLLHLVSNNGQGQRLSKSTRCIAELLELLRSAFPKYLLRKEGNQQECSTQSLELWSSVASALCMCVNNPRNEENQGLCGFILPFAVSLLNQSKFNPSVIQPLASLIGFIVSSNTHNQDQFRRCGGLQSLVVQLKFIIGKIFDSDQPHPLINLACQIISAIDFCISDNKNIAEELGTTDGIPLMLVLLKFDSLSTNEKLPIVLTLGHAVELSDDNRHFIDSETGLPGLVKILTESEDEELTSAVKYLLQICISPKNNEVDENPVSSTENAELLEKIDSMGKRLLAIEQENRQNRQSNQPTTCSGTEKAILSYLLKDREEKPLSKSAPSNVHDMLNTQEMNKQCSYLNSNYLPIKHYKHLSRNNEDQYGQFSQNQALQQLEHKKPYLFQNCLEKCPSNDPKTVNENSLMTSRYISNDMSDKQNFPGKPFELPLERNFQLPRNNEMWSEQCETVSLHGRNVNDLQRTFRSIGPQGYDRNQSELCGSLSGTNALDKSDCNSCDRNKIFSKPFQPMTNNNMNDSNTSKQHSVSSTAYNAETNLQQKDNAWRCQCQSGNENVTKDVCNNNIKSQPWILAESAGKVSDRREKNNSCVSHEIEQTVVTSTTEVSGSSQNMSVKSSNSHTDQEQIVFVKPSIPARKARAKSVQSSVCTRKSYSLKSKSPQSSTGSTGKYNTRCSVHLAPRKSAVEVYAESDCSSVMDGSEFDFGLVKSAKHHVSLDNSLTVDDVNNNVTSWASGICMNVTPLRKSLYRPAYSDGIRCGVNRLKSDPVHTIKCSHSVKQLRRLPNARPLDRISVLSESECSEQNLSDFDDDGSEFSVEKEYSEHETATENKCPGCNSLEDVLVNSRTYNILLETSPDTCDSHKEIRKLERKHIEKLKKHLGIKKKRKTLSQLNKIKMYTPLSEGPHRKKKEISIYDFHSESDCDEVHIREVSPPRSISTINEKVLPKRTVHNRRCRIPYTEEEEANLIEGVRMYGTKWSQILLTFKFNSVRTALDLKEKYSRLVDSKEKPSNKQEIKSGKPVHDNRPLSMCEERRLIRGVKKFGYSWKAILNAFTFSKNRTTEDLRNKWRSLHKKSKK